MLGPAALRAIAAAGVAASPRFDRDRFLAAAGQGLEALSIMQRVRHIADALQGALPRDLAAALPILRAMGPHLTQGFQAVAVSEYAARFGLPAFDEALETIAALTRYGSGEFAVRPFLAADPARSLARMQDWARHEDAHRRRLASEGSRPRLPWAGRVPALQADPTLAAPILEALKADPSPYVRRSVANHLNDISRERPGWVLDRLAQWDQQDPGTRWIVRHALRSLIKAGDTRALALIGAGGAPQVEMLDFSITPETLTLGGRITLRAELLSRADTPQKLVVDYRIHYVRAGGRSGAKVFKLRTFLLAPGAQASLATGQEIRDFSTRRHCPGQHRVELLVNGQAMAQASFALLAGA
ncbi:DNA alkylation repair protein [Pseudoroseomonas cervicalis]|uniref:DNA alkylation repair protein n=1 Tax=Teichococcus cervicalis TaxID=204525 RepID=UPI0022F157A1|nr:DNA alkylation repair protein [Pseudoroseomonas cervicalis]WBV45065.1 DNA alkylation repair protein [Pseudoroseomonas cervicalis]